MSTELLIGGRVQADYVIIRQQLDMANEQLADMQREMERAQVRNNNNNIVFKQCFSTFHFRWKMRTEWPAQLAKSNRKWMG
jgi:hypothetical protein